MKEISILCCIAYFWLYLASPTVASSVVEDGATIISENEFKVLLNTVPPDVIRQLKQGGPASTWEFLDELVKNKRIAAEAETLSYDKDGLDYWRLLLSVQTARIKFMEKKFLNELKMPSFSKLARERYDGNKDKIAKIPEGRRSSHILLRCGEACDSMDKIAEGRELRERLVSGESFEALVRKYSDDPGSRNKKGKIDAWIERLDGRFVREYVKGLYAIEEVGGYSKVVLSKFGVHIIRLDEIREGYLPFREMKADLIKKLEQEYRQAKLAQYRDTFSLGEDTKIYPKVLQQVINGY